MEAKITDLGVARIVPHVRAAATMTKGPGNIIYMPPEVMENKPGDVEEQNKKSKYDVSIDVFSFGVVAIFTLSQTFPCDLLAHNYREGRRHIARTELERREHYMRMIYSQLRENHPLLQMIERCLDFPEDRPSIRQVVHLLEQARTEDRDDQMDMNKLELVQALHTQPRNQVSERVFSDCLCVFLSVCMCPEFRTRRSSVSCGRECCPTATNSCQGDGAHSEGMYLYM